MGARICSGHSLPVLVAVATAAGGDTGRWRPWRLTISRLTLNSQTISSQLSTPKAFASRLSTLN
jgi:hypothetical protein